MNNAMEVDWLDRLIHTRRSIRKFKPTVVPENQIQEMIRCALAAPSPSNSRPARFIRIADAEKRRELHQAMIRRHDEWMESIQANRELKPLRNRIRVYWRYSEFMFAAPLLLAAGISTQYNSFAAHLAEASLNSGLSDPSADLSISLGLALNGFLLKAHALGLGACILTAPLSFLPQANILAIPEDIRIRCFIAAGIPDETPRPEVMPPLENFYWSL